MFLAYKAISQKTSSFFQKLCKENHNEFYKLIENTAGVFPQSTKNYGSSINESSTSSCEGTNTTLEEEKSVENIEVISLLSNGKLKSTDPPVGVEEFDGYDIFFNMVTDLKHASILEIFERIIMSTFLLNCLEATNYFENDKFNFNDETNNDNKEKDFELQKRIMFSGLIFQAYSVTLSNNHTIGEVDSLNVENELELSSFVGIKRNLTGNCVFPRVASILNHSCDPNTSPVYINGKTQVLHNLSTSTKHI